MGTSEGLLEAEKAEALEHLGAIAQSFATNFTHIAASDGWTKCGLNRPLDVNLRRRNVLYQVSYRRPSPLVAPRLAAAEVVPSDVIHGPTRDNNGITNQQRPAGAMNTDGPNPVRTE